jgi:hypothetical protein
MIFMASSTDHIPGATGLTLTITASKNGGAFASIAPVVTERGNGWYYLALTAAMLDTLGDFIVHAEATGADPSELPMEVVAYDPQSGTNLGLSNLDATISSIAASVWGYGSRTLSSFGSLVSDIATAVWGSGTRTLTSFGTLISDIWAYGTRTLTSFGTLISDIWAYGTRTLTAFGFNVTVATNNDKTGYSLLTNPPTAVQIRQEIDSNSTKLDVAVSTRSTLTASDVWNYATRTLTSFGTLISDIWGYVTRTLTSASGPTKEEIRTEIDNNSTRLSAIQTTTDKVSGMIENAGAYNRFTTHALEQAPSGGGGMTGSYLLTINTKDSGGANVVEASVELLDSLGTTLYERKLSNSSGQAVFNADDGVYIVRIHKAGYSFSSASVTVAGSSSEHFFIGTALVIPSPLDPDLCRCAMYLRYQDGTIPQEIQAYTELIDLPFVEDNSAYSGIRFAGVYDISTGLIYWDIKRGATAALTIVDLGIDRMKFVVPDQATAEFVDLIDFEEYGG